MPRRTFGPSVGSSVNDTTPDRNGTRRSVESSSASPPVNPSPNNNSRSKSFLSKLKKPFVAIPICAAIAVGSGIGIYTIGFDSGNGAGSPQEAAVGFVQASSDRSDNVWSYLPKSVRDTRTGSSSVLWELDDTFHVELSDIQVSSVQVTRDNIDNISNGYESFYHRSVSVDDAVDVDITANAKTVGGDTESVNFDIICVKVGFRWYVYTGADLTETDFDQPQSVILKAVSQDSESPDEVVQVSNVPAVEPYDGAVDDLKAGKATIDGKDYTMPARYKDMTDLFVLADEAIEKKDRTLTENMILKFLPVIYNSAVSTSFCVDIANPDAKDVDLAEGVVSTLQIARSTENLKSAEVVLPGNVCFGTSKSDVESVYGKMEQYTGTDEDLNSFGYDNSNIYRIRITDNNDYNWLYFIFDDADTLYAVEWRYYDLSVIL